MVDPETGDADPLDDCVAAWCADEEWCAVTCTMDVIGNKWHPVIVLLLLRDGPLGFSALQERTNGVTGKVLSESLDALVEDGVVVRREVSERPRRVEYSLTPAGEALEPVVAALEAWGARYLSGGGAGAGAADGRDRDSGRSDVQRDRDDSLDGKAPSGGPGGRHAAAGPEFDQ